MELKSYKMGTTKLQKLITAITVVFGLTLFTNTLFAQDSTFVVKCWAISDQGNPDRLFEFNPVDSTWTDIGPTGVNGIEAMAYDPFSGTMYTVDNNTLGTIDLATGLFTPIVLNQAIGSGNGSQGILTMTDIDGMTFDPFTGTLWASQRRGGTPHDLLIQIDPATGLLIPGVFDNGHDYVIVEEVWDPVNNQFVFDVDDIAMDPYNGDLYVISNQGGLGGVLTIIDTYTGKVDSVIGNFGAVDDMEALSFYNSGTLWGTTGNNGPDTTDNNKFFFIDKGDASPSFIGPVSDTQVDFEACDCLSGEPNLITGTVFFDGDQDAQLGAAEQGLDSIKIELWRDVDGDGQFGPADDLVACYYTDANGEYEIEIASTGDFLLKVDTSTLPPYVYMTTDNIEVANFDGVGQHDPNNDFGVYGFPLPIELAWLNVTADDCGAIVEWATATEQDVERFEIELSTDGVNFKTVATVAATGNSTQLVEYSTKVEDLQRINYFRLRSIDTDGSMQISDVERFESTCFDEIDFGVSNASPNPASSTTSVIVYNAAAAHDAQIMLTDAAGKIVKVFTNTVLTGETLIELNVSELAVGVYFLEVQSPHWSSQIQKLVIANK